MPRRRPLFDPFPLPFGDEFEALQMGYAEFGKRNALAQGYNRAAYKANQNLIRDTPTGFIVVDMADGPVGRSMSYADIYSAYTADLRRAGVNKAENLHHAFKAHVGLREVRRFRSQMGYPEPIHGIYAGGSTSLTRERFGKLTTQMLLPQRLPQKQPQKQPQRHLPKDS